MQRSGLLMWMAAPALPRLPALTAEERAALVLPLVRAYEQGHPNSIVWHGVVVGTAYGLLLFLDAFRGVPAIAQFVVIMALQFVGHWGRALLIGRQIHHAIRVDLRAAGRCTSCGYDLRATPSRCPECGRAA
jgi:hypothetical protein